MTAIIFLPAIILGLLHVQSIGIQSRREAVRVRRAYLSRED